MNHVMVTIGYHLQDRPRIKEHMNILSSERLTCASCQTLSLLRTSGPFLGDSISRSAIVNCFAPAQCVLLRHSSRYMGRM